MTSTHIVVTAVLAALYLLLGWLAYRKINEHVEEPNRYAPWVEIPLLPIVLFGLLPAYLLRVSPFIMGRRIPGERIFLFIQRCRERHHKMMYRVKHAEREAANAWKHAQDVDARSEARARGLAKGILNRRWVDAVSAAREALAGELTKDLECPPNPVGEVVTITDSEE